MDLGNLFNMAAIGVGGLLTAGWLTSMFYIVKQKQEALITSFGKHVGTTQTPGFKVKAPWPFQVVEKKLFTDLQQAEEMLETKTKDNLFVGLPITIQYEIDDTAKYYFDNRDPDGNMRKAVSAAVRKYTSGKDFQELYDERDEISEAVIQDVTSQVGEYGITIRHIIVDEPSAPGSVQESYNRVRASEKERDAATNEAAAEKIRIVARAEADKERDILRGQGAAGYRKEIFDQYAEQIQALVDNGTPREEAVSFMKKIMELDTWREVGEQGNMVIVTGEQNDAAKKLTELQAFGKTIPANDTGPAASAATPQQPQLKP